MIRKKAMALVVMFGAMCVGIQFSHSLSAYQLPDTGRHTCYDDQGNVIDCPSLGEPFHDQERQYQGAVPAYQDNSDGTVTDLNIGLIWMQNTADTDEDGDIDSNDQLNWHAACDYCADLSYAGHSDWRIPNRRELMSIVDYGRSPAINPVFGCLSSGYWTGSTDAGYHGGAWSVGFNVGYAGSNYKSNERYVRCVRGGHGYDAR